MEPSEKRRERRVGWNIGGTNLSDGMTGSLAGGVKFVCGGVNPTGVSDSEGEGKFITGTCATIDDMEGEGAGDG